MASMVYVFRFDRLLADVDDRGEGHLISAPRGVHENGSVVIGGLQELFYSLSMRTQEEATCMCCCSLLREIILTVQRDRTVDQYKQIAGVTR